MKGLVVDRGYIYIRIWPWGRQNKPYIEHFGPDTPENRKIAAYKLRDYRNKLSLGTFDIEPPAKPLVFKDAAAKIIKDHKASMKYAFVSLIDFFGNYFLHDITPDLVTKWRAARSKEGVVFSTINREQAVLSVVFEKFKEWNATNGLLGDKVKLPKENPCQFVVKPTEVHRKRSRVLSPEEWDRLTPYLAALAIDDRNHRLSLPAGWLLDHCKMAIYSSLRLKDISQLAGKTISGDILQDLQAKNAAKGIVYRMPLTESLRAIAMRIASRPFVKAWIVQKYFKGVCDESGIRDCTFRDLRRTGLSWMDKLGVRRTVVRDRAGHTNSKTTDLYIGSDTGEQLEGIRMLEDKFK